MKVMEIDKELQGKNIIKKYETELNHLMTKEQIDNDLMLFISLWKVQNGT